MPGSWTGWPPEMALPIRRHHEAGPGTRSGGPAGVAGPTVPLDGEMGVRLVRCEA